MGFAIVGDWDTAEDRFLDALQGEMRRRGMVQADQAEARESTVVFHVLEPGRIIPYRRRSQSVYVVSVVFLDQWPDNLLHFGYPMLIRSLGNLLLMTDRDPSACRAAFVTLEQGSYVVEGDGGFDRWIAKVVDRLWPLATSRLVINNRFEPDLPESLWEGDAVSKRLCEAGRRLDEWDLLPAPFPMEQLLSPRDMRHIHHLFGIGGLSYGNLSARCPSGGFWMSASGVNKGAMTTVGEHVLLVKDYDETHNEMVLSVPPHIQPRRVSVDAIEHWMIYRDHPQVGAIVHVHAWMDGVKATQVNYPCGTIQLAREVAGLVREAPRPERAVIGLKNHGLTITGTDLDDIFARIDGKILRHVPMV
ncbi:MAG: class II aldolase/adducin family protein [Kyrpidia tusciae]|nr:class II aldolase/adducin family protein [Kyrpidia tusciae]MBE3552056.1 class II aldolase/adducin family protein [Kyrpidia tusciae]